MNSSQKVSCLVQLCACKALKLGAGRLVHTLCHLHLPIKSKSSPLFSGPQAQFCMKMPFELKTQITVELGWEVTPVAQFLRRGGENGGYGAWSCQVHTLSRLRKRHTSQACLRAYPQGHWKVSVSPNTGSLRCQGPSRPDDSEGWQGNVQAWKLGVPFSSTNCLKDQLGFFCIESVST